MLNPQTLMYQNQLMYQALQDPATVAYLIQQQQQAQAQLLASRNTEQSKSSNITDLWSQRSQQLFGAGQKFGKNQSRSTTSKKSSKSPKMRPDEGEMILPDA